MTWTCLHIIAGSNAGRLIVSNPFQGALKSILGDQHYVVDLGYCGGVMRRLCFDRAVTIEAILHFFRAAASLLRKEDHDTLDELRRMAGYYTRDEVEELIPRLVTVARGHLPGSPAVEEMMYAHPWTIKFLAQFTEADRFRELVRHADVTASIGPEEERYREMRQRSNLPQQLLASVSSEAAGKRGREFRFQELPDGFYLPLNR